MSRLTHLYARFPSPSDGTGDITMVICPGIGNHSEKHYIRTFVDYSQREGYRCAVLNHLGALPNIELTSPRMFTYGETLSDTGILCLGGVCTRPV